MRIKAVVGTMLAMAAGAPGAQAGSAPLTLGISDGQSQAAYVGAAFSHQLKVRPVYRGNLLPGRDVTFTAPALGPSGTFANGSNSQRVSTDGDGVAAVDLTANDTPGTYTVQASIDLHDSIWDGDVSATATFTVANVPRGTGQLPETTIVVHQNAAAGPSSPWPAIPPGHSVHQGLVDLPSGGASSCGVDAGTIVFSGGYATTAALTPQVAHESCQLSTFVLDSGTEYSDTEANFIYSTLQQCAHGTPFVPRYLSSQLSTSTGAPIDRRLFELTQEQRRAGVVVNLPNGCNKWYVHAPIAYRQFLDWLVAARIGGGQNDPFLSVPAGMLDVVRNFARQADGGTRYIAPAAELGNCNRGCLFTKRNWMFSLVPYLLPLEYRPDHGHDDIAAIGSQTGALFDYTKAFYGFIQQGCGSSGEDMVLRPYVPNEFAVPLPVFTHLQYAPAWPTCIAYSSDECRVGARTKLDTTTKWATFFTFSGNVDNPAGPHCSYQPTRTLDLTKCQGILFDLDPVCEVLATAEKSGGALKFMNLLDSTAAAPDGAAASVDPGTAASATATSRIEDAATRPPATAMPAVTSSDAVAVTGQAVTYSATVPAFDAGAPGTVQFADAGAVIDGCSAVPLNTAEGTATCRLTYAHPGGHAITAGYSGDRSTPARYSQALMQEAVLPAPTATSVEVSDETPVVGQAVTYRAAVAVEAPGSWTPTGEASFSEDGEPLPGCAHRPLDGDGVAVCTVTYDEVGQHAVHASFAGDGDRSSSSSPATLASVERAATSTVLAASGEAVAGQAVTYTATVAVAAPGSGAPTGSVSFRDGDGPIDGCAERAVQADGTATCTTAHEHAGPRSLGAVYSGDAARLGSTAEALGVEIGRAATTTTVTSSASPAPYGRPITLRARVTVDAPGAGAPGGVVTFASGDVPLGEATLQSDGAGGRVASITSDVLHAGEATITATYVGGADFEPGTGSFVQSVTAAPTTLAVRDASVVGTVLGLGTATLRATLTSDVTDGGIPGRTVAFRVAGAPACSAVTSATGVATCTTSANLARLLLPGTAITATFAGTRDHEPSAGAASVWLV